MCEHWPLDYFCTSGQVPNMSALRVLHSSWKSGTTKFRWLSDAEHTAWVREYERRRREGLLPAPLVSTTVSKLPGLPFGVSQGVHVIGDVEQTVASAQTVVVAQTITTAQNVDAQDVQAAAALQNADAQTVVPQSVAAVQNITTQSDITVQGTTGAQNAAAAAGTIVAIGQDANVASQVTTVFQPVLQSMVIPQPSVLPFNPATPGPHAFTPLTIGDPAGSSEFIITTFAAVPQAQPSSTTSQGRKRAAAAPPDGDPAFSKKPRADKGKPRGPNIRTRKRLEEQQRSAEAARLQQQQVSLPSSEP